MAEVHSRAARAAGASLLGLASSSAARAAAAAERYGFERGYESPQELIADPRIDVVHICTPNTTHAPLALAALDAGKHVICEKPLTTSASDAMVLRRRAQETGLVATVPFVYRFHPMVREARARAAAGELGGLLNLSGVYLQDWLLGQDDDNWRVDSAQGGSSRAFADIGSHLVDIIEFVAGDRILRLNAVTRTVFDRRGDRPVDTEDAVAVIVQTVAGAIGTLLVSQVSPGRKNHLTFELAGSRRSLRFEQELPETLWLGGRDRSEVLARDADRLSPDAARLSVLPPGHPLGYQDAFNAFVADSYAAVSGERPDGLPAFEDGYRAVVLTEAVLESAADETWIDVPST